MPSGGARPGAGRKPGVPTRKTVEIAEKLAALGCDPIEGMAKIALGHVPCPRCQGAALAKYRLVGDEFTFDPEVGVEMLCRTCWGTGREPIETKLKADMHKELAQYVAPKRRAIEHGATGSVLEALLGRLGD